MRELLLNWPKLSDETIWRQLLTLKRRTMIYSVAWRVKQKQSLILHRWQLRKVVDPTTSIVIAPPPPPVIQAERENIVAVMSSSYRKQPVKKIPIRKGHHS